VGKTHFQILTSSGGRRGLGLSAGLTLGLLFRLDRFAGFIRNSLWIGGIGGDVAVPIDAAVRAGGRRADRLRDEIALFEGDLPFDAARDAARHRVRDLLRHTVGDSLIDRILFPPRFAVGNAASDCFGDDLAGADGDTADAFFLHHAASADRHLIRNDLVDPAARPHGDLIDDLFTHHAARPHGNFGHDFFRHIAAGLHRAVLANDLGLPGRVLNLPFDDSPAVNRTINGITWRLHHAQPGAAALVLHEPRQRRTGNADGLHRPFAAVLLNRATSRDGTHYGVTPLLVDGLDDGPHHHTAAFALAGLEHRPLHGAAAFAGRGFPDRLADGVTAIAIARLPDRTADGKSFFALGTFPNRTTNFNLAFALFALGDISIASDGTVFIYGFVFGPLALHLLLIVNRLAHRAKTLAAFDAAGGIACGRLTGSRRAATVTARSAISVCLGGLTGPDCQKGQPDDESHTFTDHVVVSWFDRPREIAWLGFPVYPRISQYCFFSACSLFSDYARKRAAFANE